MSMYNKIEGFSLFLNNKYSRWYFQLVDSARKKNERETYLESQHIFPKSIFPEYKSLKQNEWNCVRLTSKEHFIAHLLLTKCFSDYSHIGKMKFAVKRMSGNSPYNARIFPTFKQKLSHTLESKKKISDSLFGRPCSLETRKKIGQGNKDKLVSNETKTKLSKALTGRKLSTETKEKMSIANLGKGLKGNIKCPYCNKEGGARVMKRWHFDNCSSN